MTTAIRQRAARRLLVPLLLALLALVQVQPASATVGDEGCTPGYWKNHHDAWPAPHAPGDAVGATSAFWFLGSATWLANHDTSGAYSGFGSDTLDDALAYPGGRGVDGATRILLRAATASLLNTASGGVAYITVNQPQIVTWVKDALETNNRSTILALATYLDNANNAPDGCPLN